MPWDRLVTDRISSLLELVERISDQLHSHLRHELFVRTSF